MYDAVSGIALVAATVTTGLAAGLFYGFFYSVMPGLARSGDRTYVEAMQQINRAILNGWFALCFAGAMVFTILAAIFHLDEDGRPVLWWILAAAVLYVLVLAVTFVVNVPLNNELDTAGDPASIDVAAVRERFERKWVQWNAIRTALNIGAFICLAWALVLHGQM